LQAKVTAIQRLTAAKDGFEGLPYISILNDPINLGFWLGKIAVLPMLSGIWVMLSQSLLLRHQW
jgi:hypothetical protein